MVNPSWEHTFLNWTFFRVFKSLSCVVKKNWTSANFVVTLHENKYEFLTFVQHKLNLVLWYCIFKNNDTEFKIFGWNELIKLWTFQTFPEDWV